MQVLRAHIRLRREAEAQYAARAGQRRPEARVGVVGVDDRHTVGGEARKELTLAACDAFARAEAFEVSVASLGDDAERRFGEPGQQRDLASRAGTHLDHRRAVLAAQFQQRQRHADVVVEVALGRQHRSARGHHRGEQLLRRGLAVAAGHANDGQVEIRAPAGSELLQADQRVGHHDLRDRRVDAARHQRTDRALAGGLGDEVVRVEALAPQGREEITGLHRARIADDPCVDGIAALQRCVQSTSGGRQGFHHARASDSLRPSKNTATSARGAHSRTRARAPRSRHRVMRAPPLRPPRRRRRGR